jgi:hypothetical protein
MQPTMRASTIGRARRRPLSYGEHRVCVAEGCGVRLSRYNKSDHCFQHAPARFPRLRGEFSEEWVARNA